MVSSTFFKTFLATPSNFLRGSFTSVESPGKVEERVKTLGAVTSGMETEGISADKIGTSLTSIGAR
jgi:hypothetical protein